MAESDDNVFHAGEQQVQACFGLQERMQQAGRMAIRSFMPPQHRELFEKLPLVFLGALDAGQQPWASPRVGLPGFVTTPSDTQLYIHAGALPHDPLAGLQVGQDVGLLGLEFETRRRNRVSARLTAIHPQGLELEVKQSFGNCPKYIQTRFLQAPSAQAVRAQLLQTRAGTFSPATDLEILGPEHQQLIRQSESFFIASVYQEPDTGNHQASNLGADVSHRGGYPGFVKVEAGRVLTFPDFSGNRYFNTLGNLSLNPRAGLLFLDYPRGDLLYLTGQAEILWSGPQVEAFAGAERLVRFTLRQGRFVPGGMPWRWHLGDYSPALAATGRWPEPLSG